jgi:hypothetical protein
MKILKNKSVQQSRSLSVRVPEPLYGRIDSLRQSAEAAGYEFSVTDICIEALTRAVRQAEAELGALDGASKP